MKRRDLLASTAILPAMAYFGIAPRVPKEWSDPRHSDRLVFVISMGPSSSVGAAPCLDDDDYTQPRMPWGAPPGTPPNRIVG